MEDHGFSPDLAQEEAEVAELLERTKKLEAEAEAAKAAAARSPEDYSSFAEVLMLELKARHPRLTGQRRAQLAEAAWSRGLNASMLEQALSFVDESLASEEPLIAQFAVGTRAPLAAAQEVFGDPARDANPGASADAEAEATPAPEAACVLRPPDEWLPGAASVGEGVPSEPLSGSVQEVRLSARRALEEAQSGLDVAALRDEVCPACACATAGPESLRFARPHRCRQKLSR
eukprot:SAG11_NODE_3215_length_2605_cov_2.049880_1_plen_232_part_00